jgi:hypothetical protein
LEAVAVEPGISVTVVTVAVPLSVLISQQVAVTALTGTTVTQAVLVDKAAVVTLTSGAAADSLTTAVVAASVDPPTSVVQ